MEFWGSAEVFQPAYAALRLCRRCTERVLNPEFSNSSLADFECKIRFIPIVMPAGMRERYPARSKLIKKERIWDLSPHLNYEVFVEGTFENQLQEYLREIALSGPRLEILGATDEQLTDFEEIMESAAVGIVREFGGLDGHQVFS